MPTYNLCSMQFAVCNLHFEVYSLKCVVFNMHCAVLREPWQPFPCPLTRGFLGCRCHSSPRDFQGTVFGVQCILFDVAQYAMLVVYFSIVCWVQLYLVAQCAVPPSSQGGAWQALICTEFFLLVCKKATNSDN